MLFSALLRPAAITYEIKQLCQESGDPAKRDLPLPYEPVLGTVNGARAPLTLVRYRTVNGARAPLTGLYGPVGPIALLTGPVGPIEAHRAHRARGIGPYTAQRAG